MRFPDTPLVLLHAFPLDHRMWDAITVPDGVELVTPDQRGFGGTPLGADEPDLAHVAADVIALLDGRPALVGGCSMGTYVAMAILRAAPELVAGLVLVSGRTGADAEAARANRHTMAARIEAEGPGFVADAMVPGLLGSETHERRPDVVETVRTLVSEQDAIVPAEEADALATSMPKAEVVTLSGAGHLPPLEAPDEFSAALARWLE
jgi:pimeloyl-ACP methyl ester carboxylesterase